jgi:hypothetical protein
MQVHGTLKLLDLQEIEVTPLSLLENTITVTL